jgi:hypothetical protein
MTPGIGDRPERAPNKAGLPSVLVSYSALVVIGPIYLPDWLGRVVYDLFSNHF